MSKNILILFKRAFYIHCNNLRSFWQILVWRGRYYLCSGIPLRSRSCDCTRALFLSVGAEQQESFRSTCILMLSRMVWNDLTSVETRNSRGDLETVSISVSACTLYSSTVLVSSVLCRCPASHAWPGLFWFPLLLLWTTQHWYEHILHYYSHHGALSVGRTIKLKLFKYLIA